MGGATAGAGAGARPSLPFLVGTVWKGSVLGSSGGARGVGAGDGGGGAVQPGVRDRRRDPARSLKAVTVMLPSTSHSTTVSRTPGSLGLLLVAGSLPVTRAILKWREFGTALPPFSMHSTEPSFKLACLSVMPSSSYKHTPAIKTTVIVTIMLMVKRLYKN